MAYPEIYITLSNQKDSDKHKYIGQKNADKNMRPISLDCPNFYLQRWGTHSITLLRHENIIDSRNNNESDVKNEDCEDF